MLSTQGYGAGFSIATYGYGRFSGTFVVVVTTVKLFFCAIRDNYFSVRSRCEDINSDRDVEHERGPLCR